MVEQFRQRVSTVKKWGRLDYHSNRTSRNFRDETLAIFEK
jgi:hypothetical protein